jgi:hypothetical protein
MQRKRPRPKSQSVEQRVRRLLNCPLSREQSDAAVVRWTIENIIDSKHDRRRLKRILRRAARDAKDTC